MSGAADGFAERLAAVRARIAGACAAAGRDPSSVRLLAVSKTKPPEAVREAYGAGLRDFGESYAQELEAKARALADLPDLRWHFIGHLQTNKAKVVARVASAVHTVDSVHLARELGKRAQREGRELDAFVEVNVGGEAQKSGCAPRELEAVLDAVAREAPWLRSVGLMTVPPDDEAATRAAFGTLATLRNLHGGAARLPELSMGMSDDLELAVAAGSTWVRVGTALFGARPPAGAP